MLQSIEQMIFRHLTPLSVRYLPPPDIGGAAGLTAEVYRQLGEEFQTVPPVTMHHLNPVLMAGVWSGCRETLVAGPERVLKEAVAVAVSESNNCPYCIEAHTSMLQGAGRGRSVFALNSVTRDGSAVRDVALWAATTGDSRSPMLHEPPFSAGEAPFVMGTVVMFHYINRMVNLFLDDTMMPVIGKVPLLRDQAFNIFSTFVSGRITAKEAPQGAFLTPVPGTVLPEAFAWALPESHVAGGLLRFAAAAEDAGAVSVDPEVRRLVTGVVDDWSGGSPGPGKGWLELALQRLPELLRPQARIALLAALSSWAVEEREINGLMEKSGGRVVLDTAAWGAYTAAKRIASWLQAPS